jgi:chloramphenicol-sensitive protein RarD
MTVGALRKKPAEISADFVDHVQSESSSR